MPLFNLRAGDCKIINKKHFLLRGTPNALTVARKTGEFRVTVNCSVGPFVLSVRYFAVLHHSNGHGNDGYFAGSYTGFYAHDDGLFSIRPLLYQSCFFSS